MKIGVWDNLPSGGGKRALYEQVKRLAQRGHSVESWCPDSADRSYLPIAEFGPQHVVPLHGPKPRGPSSIWALKAWRRLRQTEELIEALRRCCRVCAGQINDAGLDVVFVNSTQWLASPPLGRELRVPSVFYLQEPIRSLHEARPDLPWVGSGDSLDSVSAALRRPWRSLGDLFELLRHRRLARAEIEHARGFKTVLVNSLYSRETLLRVYGMESEVCYLGIDTDHFAPGVSDRKEAYVVGMGELTHAKGVDRAIRAVAAIAAPERPPLVWICNRIDGDYAETMKRLAGELGVRFEWRQRVTDAEVSSILGRAAVMVYVSRLEPFGLSPLEANACGTTVAGIAEGGVRETIVEGVNGTLARCDSPTALGASLRAWVVDLPAAAAAGARARQHVVAHWGWEQSISQLESYLRKGIAS